MKILTRISVQKTFLIIIYFILLYFFYQLEDLKIAKNQRHRFNEFNRIAAPITNS